jgi:hypothetical protein
MTAPEDALRELASQLRVEDTVISPHVVDPVAEPALGLLVAAGSRAAGAPAEYALVIEAIREGYLLHYGSPRVVLASDRDLALLAGDYLYALGLDRLAHLGDRAAVAELADLISLQAQIHADSDGSGAGSEATASALWLASSIAVATGAGERHGEAKRALREGLPEAADRLRAAAAEGAEGSGLGDRLLHCAEAIA